MAKAIATVQLGIARLGVEISDRQTDAEIAAWVRSFHRALVMHKPELNEYAAELLDEVEAFRKADSLRKTKNLPPDSTGFHGNQTDSVSSQSVSQSASKKEKKNNTGVRFAPPTLQEVQEYCTERNNKIDPQGFIDHYEARGWKLKGVAMVSWKACVRTWEKNAFGGNNGTIKQSRTERLDADAASFKRQLESGGS